MMYIFLLFTQFSCESSSDTEYHSDVELERSYLRSRSREKSDSKEYSGYSSLRGKCVTFFINILRINTCFGFFLFAVLL